MTALRVPFALGVVLTAGLLLAACAPKAFTKEGKQDEAMAQQYARDE